MTKERVASLLQTVEPCDQVLILPHNDPDPDAIASAVALRYLFAQQLDVIVHIAYRGIIGRAENKALVRYLDRPLRRLTGTDLRRVPIVLVDTQPGAGNNALVAQSTLLAVIDHHTWRETSTAAAYVDVRPQLGATSTIITEYLQAAGVELSSQLATALFYGIKTDTMGLIRGAGAEDVEAYFELQPRIDVDALLDIERAQVPIEYFEKLDATLRGAHIYNQVILSYIGTMNRPDMAGEMADLLLRLQGVEWVICSGIYKDRLILAVRTRSRRGSAGKLAQAIVGLQGTAGGHGTMAGGQVSIGDRDAAQLAAQLGELALQHLQVGRTVHSKPLIPLTK
ncbi:MAG: DHH family phosphoesterase [Anaerolineae bacterium]|nr:DHH family phosphoesterase [Anaerolineae bacterium]